MSFFARRSPRFNQPRASDAVAGDIAGTCDLVFGEGSSVALGAGALAGASAMTFGGTDVLLGAGVLAGASAITFAGTDTLLGAGALAGAGAIVFTPTGTLVVPPGDVAGSAAMLFGGSAPLTGSGALAGTAMLQFLGTATLVRPTTTGESFSGGYFPNIHRPTPDERKQRRIALGILPPEEQKQAEQAIEQVVQATVALAKAKPETQAATDALKSQARAEKLFSEAYRKVYPALEQAQILDAMHKEAQRLQEEEYAFVLSLL